MCVPMVVIAMGSACHAIADMGETEKENATVIVRMAVGSAVSSLKESNTMRLAIP